MKPTRQTTRKNNPIHGTKRKQSSIEHAFARAEVSVPVKYYAGVPMPVNGDVSVHQVSVHDCDVIIGNNVVYVRCKIEALTTILVRLLRRSYRFRTTTLKS